MPRSATRAKPQADCDRERSGYLLRRREAPLSARLRSPAQRLLRVAASAARSFSIDVGRARADEVRVGQLPLLAGDGACRAGPVPWSLRAISAATSISRPGRRTPRARPTTMLALVGGRLHVGPPGGRLWRRPSTRNTAASAAAVRPSRRRSGRVNCDRRLGRNVLPAANLAQPAQHLLEAGEAGFDLARSCRAVSAAGQGAIMMLSAAGSSVGQARAAARPAPSSCQTSSVMNGIIGCNSRSSVSSVWASTRCAVGRAAGVLQAAP